MKTKRQLQREREKSYLTEKLTPCADCGAFDERFMEWHHLDPSVKDGHVSKLMRDKGYPAALKEIEKCVCLCANCHRIRHAKINGGDLDSTG